jgi:hypothetical protein
LEGLDVGGGDGFALVAEPFERPVNQVLMLPGQAAEEQGGVLTLASGERIFNRLHEVLPHLGVNSHLSRQPRTFLFNFLSYCFFL